MSIDGDMRERHSRVLGELAETGMVMVRRLSEAMLAADDIQIQAQIGLAYHRVSRAVRQTLALEFRQEQDAHREARGIAAPAHPTPRTQPAPVPASTPRVRAERTGWDEYESDDSDELLDELDELLDAEDVDLDAVHEAVEACIVRIRDDLDIPTPRIETRAARAETTPGGAVGLPVGPGGRRSRLMGGAALAPPPNSPPRPPSLPRRSSA